MLTIQEAPIGLGSHVFAITLAALLILSTLIFHRIYTARMHRVDPPQRPGQTEDSFVHAMASLGLNPRIARTTYRHLQQSRNIRFPILVNDRLHQELGLEGRAISETIRRLLVENDRQPLPGWRINSIITVEDLVGFIQSSPRAEHELAA